MNYIIYFKGLFESISEYRKNVLLGTLIKNDVDLTHECGYLRNDFNRLCIEF